MPLTLLHVVLAVAGVLGVLLLLELKTSRPDGTPIKEHPFRVLLATVMPTRTESQVYFDAWADATKLVPYLDRAKGEFNANMTHALVYAAMIGLKETPWINRFVMGRRIYQRNGRFVTFSIKRTKRSGKAKISEIKTEHTDDMDFRALCDKVNAGISEERSGKETSADKEFKFFTFFPRVVLRQAHYFLRWLDYYNLLPSKFIHDDGMYTSIFLANLGSVGMEPGYHHLYEWGNCPIFIMVGAVEDRLSMVDGEVVATPSLHLRFTYDERVGDALAALHGFGAMIRVLENPEEELGGLA